MKIDTMQPINIKGYVKNNVIMLYDDIQLPDGIKVNVIVPPNVTKSSGLCGIWKDNRPVEEIVEDMMTSRTKGRESA
jgi:predicted GTPase